MSRDGQSVDSGFDVPDAVKCSACGYHTRPYSALQVICGDVCCGALTIIPKAHLSTQTESEVKSCAQKNAPAEPGSLEPAQNTELKKCASNPAASGPTPPASGQIQRWRPETEADAIGDKRGTMVHHVRGLWVHFDDHAEALRVAKADHTAALADAREVERILVQFLGKVGEMLGGEPCDPPEILARLKTRLAALAAVQQRAERAEAEMADRAQYSASYRRAVDDSLEGFGTDADQPWHRIQALRAKVAEAEKESRPGDYLFAGCNQRDWVKCPICGESDMRREHEENGEGFYIACVNLACGSNGGTNFSAIAPPQPASDAGTATPRTDAEVAKYTAQGPSPEYQDVPANFARQLERELAATCRERDALLAKIPKEEPEMKPIPKYGDHYEINEENAGLIRFCRQGDGSFYWATATHFSRSRYSSQPEWATHILYFGK